MQKLKKKIFSQMVVVQGDLRTIRKKIHLEQTRVRDPRWVGSVRFVDEMSSSHFLLKNIYPEKVREIKLRE